MGTGYDCSVTRGGEWECEKRCLVIHDYLMQKVP